MKFISLFSKPPSHKRFSYEPRFYDAKAEEQREREERIRRELPQEQGIKGSESSGCRSRIAGSLQSSRKRSNKGKGELKATLLRSGLLLFLTVFAIAFLTWGEVVMYSLLLFIPLYFYLKFKK